DVAFADQAMTLEGLVAAQESDREALVAKTGENVNIRRLERVAGDVVGFYLHGNRIGAVVVLDGGDAELAKDVAMHVAASNPQYLDPTQVPEDVIAKEKEIFMTLNEDKIKGKPDNIVEKMVGGRIRKFLSDSSLVEQDFVKDPEVTVGKLVEKAGASIVSF